MKKKGFTLIELLAVIIILAIVALIATPIVLDIVDDARISAAKSEAAMIVSGINNYCAAADMRQQLNGETNPCADGVTKEEVATMVDLGNAKILEIIYNNISTDEVAILAYSGNARVANANQSGQVTKLKVESHGKIVVYDGSTYTIAGEVVETPEEPVIPTPTYQAYSVGDEVTLSDGTTWIVVKDTDSSESEIKIMSTSNVKANLTTEKGKDMFKSPYTLAYDSNHSKVWVNSTLKAYLDNTVKTRLEDSLNTTISDITIWGVEELAALGCIATGNETSGYSAVSCDKTTKWYSKVFKNAYSWTKLPDSIRKDVSLFVGTDGGFYRGYVQISSEEGARPIITVSKDVIAN